MGATVVRPHWMVVVVVVEVVMAVVVGLTQQAVQERRIRVDTGGWVWTVLLILVSLQKSRKVTSRALTTLLGIERELVVRSFGSEHNDGGTVLAKAANGWALGSSEP